MKTLSVKKCLLIIVVYFLVSFGLNFVIPENIINRDFAIYFEVVIDFLIAIIFFLITKDELRGEFNIYKAELKDNLKNTIKSTFIIYLVCDLIASVFMFIFLLVFGDNIGNGLNSDLQTIYLSSHPLLFILLAVIVGPFIEEILFRGAIFNLIAKKNEDIALIVTALIFGLIHFLADIVAGTANISLVPQLVTYLILSYALTNHYYHHRNIFDMMGIHAIYNLVSVVITLIML